MSIEQHIDNCKWLLYSLTTKEKLEQAVDAGVTADCFHEPKLQKAFEYLYKQLMRGKTIGPLDMEARFGVKQGEADTNVWAPLVVDYHLAATVRQAYIDEEQSNLLDTNPAEAVRNLRERLAWLQLPATITIEKVAGAKPPPTEWVVQDFLPEGWPCILYGKGGALKSYIAAYLALCVATGKRFFGSHPVKRMPVIYLDFEMTLDMFLQRIHELLPATGLEHLLDEAGVVEVPGLHYLKSDRPLKEMMPELEEAIRRHGAGLIIIDSFGFATAQQLETSKDPSKDVLATYQRLQGLDATVLIIDHTPHKGQHPYGSVYKLNAARFVWIVESTRGEDTSITLQHLQLDKHNVGPHQDDIYVHLEWTQQDPRIKDYELAIDITNEEAWRMATGQRAPSDKTEEGTRGSIMMAVQKLGPQTTDDLAKVVGVTAQGIEAATKLLLETGKLKKDIAYNGRGRGRPAVVYVIPGQETRSEEL